MCYPSPSDTEEREINQIIFHSSFISSVSIFSDLLPSTGGKSKELKTLEECLPTIQDFLSDGVVDLTWFAGKLTEKGLIHRQAANAVLDRQGTTNMERACGLMNAVVAQVKLDEEKYRRFCTILRDEDALSALDKELADKFLQKST